jgi:hypothetical protein
VIPRLEVTVPRGVPTTVSLPRWHAGSLADHLHQFLTALAPPIAWRVTEAPEGPADCALLVGDATTAAAQVVYAGSEGWIATVSPRGPQPVGGSPNPVGAYAAACLGIAEVWKRLLEPHRELFPGVPIVPLTEPLTFSTFSYRADAPVENPPLPEAPDLKRLTIVGLGAGGGALAFTLASLSTLQGTVSLVEPDELVPSNLNRAVFADADDARAQRPKVDVIGAILGKFPALQVQRLALPYAEACRALEREDHRHVVAAVHSRAARRQLQFETPMVLWDAGATEHGEFFVWRMILGVTECMHCKHPPGADDPEREKASQLTLLLGLDLDTWLRKVRDNERFSVSDVEAIQAHLHGQRPAFDLPSSGQRYGDWEAEQCGRLRLPEVDDEIPIPFAPVMAGVLLAGDILKERHFPSAVLDSYYWNTLLGRFMTRNEPHRRAPRADCEFCHDASYRAQYVRRWGPNVAVAVHP